jgi:gamma-glutamyltranspeptidase / glutathione hydrolase
MRLFIAIAVGRLRGRPVGSDSAETRASILRAAREVITERGYAKRTPLAAWHRGVRLLTNPPPSFGGTLIVRALTTLSSRESRLPPPGTAAALVQLTDVMDEVTRFHTAPRPRSTKGTTHVSVADHDGNLASMTTSNGSGSGVILPGTGCMANNIMGEEDLHPGGFHRAEPGVRVGSMMAPTVLRRGDGPPIAMGSGGSERIRSAITQVVLALVDHDLSLVEAVAAPRIHVVDGVVQLEPGFAPGAVARLAETWEINEWEVSDLYFGGVNAASPTGERAGDHRRGGCTALVAD